jgi:hypothetical protein
MYMKCTTVQNGGLVSTGVGFDHNMTMQRPLLTKCRVVHLERLLTSKQRDFDGVHLQNWIPKLNMESMRTSIFQNYYSTYSHGPPCILATVLPLYDVHVLMAITFMTKGLGSFEGLLQIWWNSETATPIHFKMPGLIPCVKWSIRTIFSFYSIVFIHHFTKWINPGILKWIGVAVSEFRRFCDNPSKLPSPFMTTAAVRSQRHA